MSEELDRKIEDWLGDLDKIVTEEDALKHPQIARIIRTLWGASHLDQHCISLSNDTLTDLLSAISYTCEEGNLWNYDPIIMIFTNEDADFVAHIFPKGELNGRKATRRDP